MSASLFITKRHLKKKTVVVDMSKDDKIIDAPWLAGKRVNYVLSDNEVDVVYEIWPEPMTKQPGTVFDTDTGVLSGEPTNKVDLNDNGGYDIGDNYVMFYSHDGTPAGDGNKYEFKDENWR